MFRIAKVDRAIGAYGSEGVDSKCEVPICSDHLLSSFCLLLTTLSQEISDNRVIQHLTQLKAGMRNTIDPLS